MSDLSLDSLLRGPWQGRTLCQPHTSGLNIQLPQASGAPRANPPPVVESTEATETSTAAALGVSQQVRQQPGNRTGNRAGNRTGTRYCLLKISETRCAIECTDVVHLLEIDTFTTIPTAPSHIAGVTFFENAVLPLVKLQSENQEEQATRPGQLAAVLEHSGVRIGLLAEEVLGLRALARPTANDSPAVSNDTLTPFCASRRLDGDQTVTVLDVAKLIASLRPAVQGSLA